MLTTEPFDVALPDGHTARVRLLGAGELLAIQQRVRAGHHPGKLKLGAVVAQRLKARAPEPVDADAADLEAHRYAQARAEAELDELDAEALALVAEVDYRAAMEALGAALVAVDGSPASGLEALLRLGTGALEAIADAVARRQIEGKV